MNADANSILKERIKDLEKENRELKKKLESLSSENKQLEEDISYASKLKYHLMPNIYPAFPDVPQMDIFADSLEVKQSGGDYYDFFRIDSDHIGFCVADIFDGGPEAALYMVAFKLYLKSQLPLADSIEERIQYVNEHLCWRNEHNLCLSAWYGIYEISSGDVKAVNAGHESAFLLTKDGVMQCENEEVSFLLGVTEGMRYQSFKFHLEPGDKLLLYTDGAVNAVDASGRDYSAERLGKAFETTKGKDPEATIGVLERKLSEFLRGSELSEDVTFLCLERKAGE